MFLFFLFWENNLDLYRYILERKIEAIFAAAVKSGKQHLILTAIGCGVFIRNKKYKVLELTKIVAETFSFIYITKFKNYFESITFAIIEESKLKIFEKELDECYEKDIDEEFMSHESPGIIL